MGSTSGGGSLRTAVIGLLLAVIGLLLAACGGDDRGSAPTVDLGSPSTAAEPACAVPGTDCECAEEGRRVQCGTVHGAAGDDAVACSVGYRTCQGGRWTSCQGTRIVDIAFPGGLSTQALGTSQKCASNPCDPYCRNYVDDPTGLTVANGLTVDGDTLTLTLTEGGTSDDACTGLVVAPDRTTLTVTAINEASNGVRAEYFNRFDKSVSQIPVSWVPDVVEAVDVIGTNFGSGGPATGIGSDGFSIRYTGRVVPPSTGTYTFSTYTDDGARLWLNGVLVVDQWRDQGSTFHASPGVSLTAGTPVDFRFEYYENSGGARSELHWTPPGGSRVQIPPSAYRPPGSGDEPLTTDPATLVLSGDVVPDGCAGGAVSPAWSVDKLGVANVDDTGTFNLVSAISGKVNVRGYAGSFVGQAEVDVVVDVLETSTAPSGSEAIFTGGTPAGTDPMRVLYPYDDVVLPLGLQPPLVQWETGGTTASAIKIGVRYPATGTPTFQWAKVLPEPTTARFSIPSVVWESFEQTARGDEALLTFQRITGGTLRPEVTRRLRFADGALRGRIYYTQYGRGSLGSDIMVVNPGVDEPAKRAFPNSAGCPVCHSMSANGTTFVTTDDRQGSTNGGISAVRADGQLDVWYNEFPNEDTYNAGGNDWRGFAWAPLSPEGDYALATNNIYGNTRERLVGIDSSTRTVSVPDAVESGSLGTGLSATYTDGTHTISRVDPHVRFDWGGGGPGGVVGSDFSASWAGFVIPRFSESIRFSVTSTDGVRLTVGGATLIDDPTYDGAERTLSGVFAATAGQRTPIALEMVDGAGDAAIRLSWEGDLTPASVVPQTQLVNEAPRRGVLATYFDNDDFTGSQAQQVEASLSLDWGRDAPVLGFGSDSWSATFEATLRPESTGDYYFCPSADDAVSLTLDGKAPGNRGFGEGADFGGASGPGAGGPLGEYFDQQDGTISEIPASWVPDGTREDAEIDFDFGNGAPGVSGVGNDDFTVRWTGYVTPTTTEDHVFSTRTDDGARLWIDGALVIDRWVNQGPTRWSSAAIPLTAGVAVPFRMEYYERGGGAVAQLEWTPASGSREIIPASALAGPAARPACSGGPSWTVGDGYTAGDQVVHLYHLWETTTDVPSAAANCAPHDPDPGCPGTWTSVGACGDIPTPSCGGQAAWSVGASYGVGDLVTHSGYLWVAQAAVASATSDCAPDNEDAGCGDPWFALASCGDAVPAGCQGPVSLQAGVDYALRADYRDFAGDADLSLEWSSPGGGVVQEPVPLRVLTPPAGSFPGAGLRQVIYASNDFNQSPGLNPGTISVERVVGNIDADWGGDRPDYSVLRSNDNFSIRYVGRLTIPCTGVTQFEVLSDDGARLWVDDVRLAGDENDGCSSGECYGAAHYTSGSTHDLKVDYLEFSSNARVQLRWKTACAGSAWEVIPPSAFTAAIGDGGTGGFTIEGGENYNGSRYHVWRMPTASGMAPTEVSSETAGRWGLGSAAMMVPSFSPDGSRLVYVDGDQAHGAGWRKGVSVFDVNLGQQLFSNRRGIVNTWPFGEVLGWPTFESDSRTVIYQSMPPGSFCCRNGWTEYGYMAPTNYFEDPGRLWSVDTDTPGSAVELLNATRGERPEDRNKSYQPTSLPSAAAGYRWVVFTSTRPYGNTFNLPSVQEDYSDPVSFTSMTNSSDLQSMLWVAAVDDTTSAGTDRSHPAFLLPNQNYGTSGSRGVLNERGFWVLEPCRPVGESCDLDSDCCGGSGSDPTAVCGLDTPISTPVTRSCKTRPAINTCALSGDACTDPGDCCGGLVCVNAQCEPPPPIDTYATANFERIYEFDCADDELGIWRFFDWRADIPDGTRIEFYAQTAADPILFKTLPEAPDPVSDPDVIYLGIASGPLLPVWTGQDVGSLLAAEGLTSQQYLKVTARLVPDDTRRKTPVLHDWRQSYSCPPSQ